MEKCEPSTLDAEAYVPWSSMQRSVHFLFLWFGPTYTKQQKTAPAPSKKDASAAEVTTYARCRTYQSLLHIRNRSASKSGAWVARERSQA